MSSGGVRTSVQLQVMPSLLSCKKKFNHCIKGDERGGVVVFIADAIGPRELAQYSILLYSWRRASQKSNVAGQVATPVEPCLLPGFLLKPPPPPTLNGLFLPWIFPTRGWNLKELLKQQTQLYLSYSPRLLLFKY
jgi:hypothetical protein